MNCPTCSKELTTQQQFCPNCGTKVEGTRPLDDEMSSPKATETSLRAETSKKPSSKVGKRIVIGVALLFLIGAATYGAFYQFVYHPERQIESIRQAVSSEDASTLAPYLLVKGEEVSTDQASAFLTGLSQAELDEDVIDYLDRAQHSMGASYDEVPVRIVKGDKQYGVYQLYELEIIPQTMVVASNFDAITVSLPSPYGKEKLEADGERVIIRDAFPGMVEVAVQYDGQYGKDEAVKTFNSFAYSDEAEPFMVAFKGLSVELDQTYADAPLLVNGEDSGKTIGEWKTYGPVPKQGIALSTVLDMPWGEVESKSVIAKPGGKPVTFTATIDETVLAFADDLITQHAREWTEFMYYEDLSYLTVVTDQEYLAKQEKTYDTMQAKNQNWYGDVDGVEVINQTLKLTTWNKRPAIETEAVVGINSQFTTDGEEDGPSRLVKSRFRYVIAEPYDDGVMHLVEATYLE